MATASQHAVGAWLLSAAALAAACVEIPSRAGSLDRGVDGMPTDGAMAEGAVPGDALRDGSLPGAWALDGEAADAAPVGPIFDDPVPPIAPAARVAWCIDAPVDVFAGDPWGDAFAAATVVWQAALYVEFERTDCAEADVIVQPPGGPTFDPARPCAEPRAGLARLALDDEARLRIELCQLGAWRDAAEAAPEGPFDRFSAALHLIGHGIGLPHERDRRAVMHPAWQGARRSLGPYDHLGAGEHHVLRPAMVWLRGGIFEMGDDDGPDDQRPARPVSLSPFFLDRFPITVGQYRRCIEEGRCTAPSLTGSRTRTDYFFDHRWRNHPMVGVTWAQAEAYCASRGLSLPTEAQWEFAVRGVDGRRYPWGEELDCTRANYARLAPHDDCADHPDALGAVTADVHRVGAWPRGYSPDGIADLAGNQWHWIADRYRDDYYRLGEDVDPPGPPAALARDNARVLRGGAFTTDRLPLSGPWRHARAAGLAAEDVGFRCAGAPEPDDAFEENNP